LTTFSNEDRPSAFVPYEVVARLTHQCKMPDFKKIHFRRYAVRFDTSTCLWYVSNDIGSQWVTFLL